MSLRVPLYKKKKLLNIKTSFMINKWKYLDQKKQKNNNSDFYIMAFVKICKRIGEEVWWPYQSKAFLLQKKHG